MSTRHVPSSSTVFTPQALASAMVRAAGDSADCVWLDPCVGDGAFVSEIATLGVPPSRIHALDISRAISKTDHFARTRRGVDFISWAASHPGSVDRVVMNPPYVALSQLRGDPRDRALKLELAGGRHLPLKANYWCAFILSAIACIRRGGTLVAVLPAAWEFARYARPIREAVVGAFAEIDVVRCATPLFPTVKDGAVVLVARNRGAKPSASRRVEVADLAAAVTTLEQLGAGRVPSGAVIVRGLPSVETAQVRLDELLEIRIGGVTGDTHYFLLTEPERVELGLPRAALRTVLTKSRHLARAVVTEAEWRRLRDNGERVWMFRPLAAALRHPAVRRYLASGKDGLCNVASYKVSSRTPWHRTPLPRQVDGFLSGMSKRLPFLVLREMEGLSATNTLYVVRFKKPVSLDQRAALGVALLTTGVRRELIRHGRQYADGLLKFEPTELGSVRIPVVARSSGARAVLTRATKLLLAGRDAEAEAMADAWVAGELRPPRSNSVVGRSGSDLPIHR